MRTPDLKNIGIDSHRLEHNLKDFYIEFGDLEERGDAMLREKSLL